MEPREVMRAIVKDRVDKQGNALFLRVLDITKKWTMPVANWPLVLGQIDVTRQDMLW